MADRAFHLVDPRGALQRVLYAALIGVIAYVVTPGSVSEIPRIMLACDAAGLGLFVIAMTIVLTADSEETRRRAASEDPGRTLVWVLVLAVCAFALFTVVFLIHAKAFSRGERDLVTGLTIGSVALAWLITHTGFTLRYAHLYYRNGEEKEGGIDFPDVDEGKPCDPDDRDFMYFAFTIGMTFQVSDAVIKSREIRRVVLLHALISFVYNTGILALVLNVVIGQVST